MKKYGWLQVQTAVRALLTPFMYARVPQPDRHVELLEILATERSDPLVVWSPAMRRQLRSLIDDHARSAPVTHSALRTLGEFKYDQVAEELVIEDVYVRLFCEVWPEKKKNAPACIFLLHLRRGLLGWISGPPIAAGWMWICWGSSLVCLQGGCCPLLLLPIGEKIAVCAIPRAVASN